MKIAESGKPRDKVADARSLYSVLNLLVWRGLLAGRVYSTKSIVSTEVLTPPASLG
jgi:hypothetical protein